MKGMRVYVYKSAVLGDCSNGGPSGKVEKITVIHPDLPELSEPYIDAPAFTLEVGNLGTGWKLVPSFEGTAATEGLVGPMFGGAYAACSDSRWNRLVGGAGVVAIHDRYETPAQYRSLSM